MIALLFAAYTLTAFLDAGYEIVGIEEAGALMTVIYLLKGDSLWACRASFDLNNQTTYLYDCYDALDPASMVDMTED